MHLASFQDAFGFFAFMVMMVMMMFFALISSRPPSGPVKDKARKVTGMAARAGAAWLMKKLKR